MSLCARLCLVLHTNRVRVCITSEHFILILSSLSSGLILQRPHVGLLHIHLLLGSSLITPFPRLLITTENSKLALMYGSHCSVTLAACQVLSSFVGLSPHLTFTTYFMVLHCTAYCLTCQVSFKLGSDLGFNVFILDCTLLAY